MSFYSDLKVFYRHYRNTSAIMRRILKDPLTVQRSEEMIGERLRSRKENFLELLEKAVYGYPNSPYKALMDRAGRGFEEVRGMVMTGGVEETLSILHGDGIYIDILEFKGKKTAVRGTDSFTFKEKDFSNPLLSGGLGTRSGGTRSAGTSIVVPLEFIEQNNPYGVIAAHDNGIMEKPAIIWLPILPAGEGLFFSLRFTAMGNPPVKWFSQVDERYIRPSRMDRLKTKSAVWMARHYGKRMAEPQFVDMRRTVDIARWMHNHRGDASGFSVVTYASSALRLVMEAKREGLGLGETVFWLMGEPLTDKIMEEIKGIGCRAYSLYGCNELMIIGQGCTNADMPDDMHFLSDKLAVIQRDRKVDHSDMAVEAFFFTTLLKSSPKIFLNTETGDYGCVETKHCGCALERLGFNRHIHTVRSFEKLTAEGATFVGSDLIPLVQRTLPAAFGGDAIDYQFLEEADEDGIPKLYILISPELGDIDEDRLREVVFETLTAGEYSHAYSRSYWTQAGTIMIKRMRPIPTARGKIVPLQIRRGAMLNP